MLDYVCIFTKGGALLWTWSLVSGAALRGSPVDALIRNWLLEERSGESSFAYTPPQGAAYSLKWTMHNVRPAFRPACQALRKCRMQPAGSLMHCMDVAQHGLLDTCRPDAQLPRGSSMHPCTSAHGACERRA